MALTVYTNIEAKELPTKIQDKIESIPNFPWSIDSSGDFVYRKLPWKFQAWMRVKLQRESKKIVFGIVGRKDKMLTTTEYAIYHGRFAEMLLYTCDKYIEKIEISSLATKDDSIPQQELSEAKLVKK